MAKKDSGPKFSSDYVKGYFAARNGSDQEANPYASPSAEWGDWDEGFRAFHNGDAPPEEPQPADAD